MCSHYEAPTTSRLLEAYGQAPAEPYQLDLWPGYTGAFVRRAAEGEEGGVEVLSGRFGLLPPWTKDPKLARSTFNARSETAAIKPSFRNAWAKAQVCIIPAVALYEPDWRSGKSIPTRISRVDSGLMGVAGLWERWKNPEGEVVMSYTMLTVNAANDPLMSNFHRPEDEKRSTCTIPNGLHNDWLNASSDQIMDFLRLYPADRLKAIGEPKT